MLKREGREFEPLCGQNSFLFVCSARERSRAFAGSALSECHFLVAFKLAILFSTTINCFLNISPKYGYDCFKVEKQSSLLKFSCSENASMVWPFSYG